MDIRIITMSTDHNLVKVLKNIFPTADVGLQRGVDLRNTGILSLYNAGLISHTAIKSLQEGRKWHHEIGSSGAVGLAQANRLALEENTDTVLLLLEDDCVINNENQLKKYVNTFMDYLDDFDVAVFGASNRSKKSTSREPWYPKDFFDVRGEFWHTQCVLYSPEGRRKVSSILNKPLEMQIDMLLASYSKVDEVKVVAEFSRNPSTTQSLHLSTIQIHNNTQGFRGVGVLTLLLCCVAYKYTIHRTSLARSL